MVMKLMIRKGEGWDTLPIFVAKEKCFSQSADKALCQIVINWIKEG